MTISVFSTSLSFVTFLCPVSTYCCLVRTTKRLDLSLLAITMRLNNHEVLGGILTYGKDVGTPTPAVRMGRKVAKMPRVSPKTTNMNGGSNAVGSLDQNVITRTPSVKSKKFEEHNKPNGRMGSILKYVNRTPRSSYASNLPLDGSTSTCSEQTSSERKLTNVGQGDNQLMLSSTADVNQFSLSHET